MILQGRKAIIAGVGEIADGIAQRLVREGAEAAQLRDHVNLGEAAERLGGLDILVLDLLGRPQVASLEDQDLAPALATVEVCAKAMRAAFPYLRSSGRGRIILVGHRYGEAVNEAIAGYNAAAWALTGLARTAAVDWGRHGIATNVLAPQADTEETRAALARRPAVIEMMVGQLPLGRLGDPVEDIGGAAVFLASDDGAFVNGQVLHADGGRQVAGPVLNPVRFQAG